MHNLAVAEATKFSNNFYIRVKETSTGVNAFKILVSRNGGISPEPGPNMMWNAKYSPMANMMGRWFVPNARNLGVASAGESKGAILSRPKKNALGTFRRAAQKQLSLGGFISDLQETINQ